MQKLEPAENKAMETVVTLVWSEELQNCIAGPGCIVVHDEDLDVDGTANLRTACPCHSGAWVDEG